MFNFLIKVGVYNSLNLKHLSPCTFNVIVPYSKCLYLKKYQKADHLS